MSRFLMLTTALVVLMLIGATVEAQDTTTGMEERAEEITGDAQRELGEISQQVNQSEQAQQVKAGILRPIYALAENFSFSAFHWLAFAVMVTGVVSFALQLTLGKLIVLSRMSFSPAEILSDALGLLVSLVGLVLTTQAATENSTFTGNAFAVLSATGAGVVLGFIFYLWGQRQELQAAAGRKRAAVQDRSSNPPARG